ncbi:MAG: fumarylacetoacetate hydrolase family protein [Pseudomonadota bacterium]
MRIATLAGPGDGRLVLVHDDLRTCRPSVAKTLQTALDLGGLAADPGEQDQPFDTARCAAPLPRGFGFLDGSAYVNHVALVRRARGADVPERVWTDPLMYQGCSVFDGPTAPIRADPAWGIDCEAEVAVITTCVPRGVTPESAPRHIAFVLLLNDVSLRHLIPDELSKGFGFVQSKPASACAPFALSPDELSGWDGRKLHGRLCIDINDTPLGRVQTGQDMTFDFGDLIAHAAKTRALPAGTVIGSGTVSNQGPDGGTGETVARGGAGYACIVEQRMVETLTTGAPVTPFLVPGDRVKIWLENETGQSIFGAIEQKVAAAWE